MEDMATGSILVETRLKEWLSPSNTHTGPAEGTTNCELLCSFKQVAQGWSKVAPDIGKP